MQRPPPSSLNPPVPAQPSLLPHQRAWRRFRCASKGIQFGLGCLVVILLLCTCASFGAAVTATKPTGSTASVVITPTPTPVMVAQNTVVPTRASIPTSTAITRPTPTLTPTPSPSPTSVPTPTSQPFSTPTPTPRPQPTQAPKPTPTPCADPCNPWGYNFVHGNLITAPPSAFCSYFACIPNFVNGHGYVVECQDSQYSKSGGIQGACSYHGGPWRTLYAHE
jgi:hypothetical protein